MLGIIETIIILLLGVVAILAAVFLSIVIIKEIIDFFN